MYAVNELGQFDVEDEKCVECGKYKDECECNDYCCEECDPNREE